jgi:D-glycero-alpha-D-manno-heptose-7-phosphate kinase
VYSRFSLPVRGAVDMANMPVSPTAAVRSRAPLRLGLAGGGTDVSPYSDVYGGAVLNATLDRYAFAFVEPSADGQIRFAADDLNVEEAFPLDIEATADARLQLHAAVYRRMLSEFAGGRPLALTVRTAVDAPPGSGLGSSSALVVALVEAFRTLLNLPLGPYEVAHLAYEIERIDLAIAGGKQDPYAAVFGGLNFIEFLPNGRVIVNPLRVPRSVLNELETSLIVCFSGVSRFSGEIIDQQQKGMIENSAKTISSMHKLKNDAVEMKGALLRSDLGGMAQVLNSSWLAKKDTANLITTERIDDLISLAGKMGALAGKVSGAGGGGFIMFLVPPERRVPIVRALNDAGAPATGVQLTFDGAESWILQGRRG